MIMPALLQAFLSDISIILYICVIILKQMLEKCNVLHISNGIWVYAYIDLNSFLCNSSVVPKIGKGVFIKNCVSVYR